MKRLSNEMLEAIGAEVRRRREAAGLSLEELGERAQLHRNHISKLELGQVDFSISALWSIAGALECDLSDLFPTRKHELTPDVLAAARLLSAADPHTRGAVMTLLERLASPAPRRRRSG